MCGNEPDVKSNVNAHALPGRGRVNFYNLTWMSASSLAPTGKAKSSHSRQTALPCVASFDEALRLVDGATSFALSNILA